MREIEYWTLCCSAKYQFKLDFADFFLGFQLVNIGLGMLFHWAYDDSFHWRGCRSAFFNSLTVPNWQMVTTCRLNRYRLQQLPGYHLTHCPLWRNTRQWSWSTLTLNPVDPQNRFWLIISEIRRERQNDKHIVWKYNWFWVSNFIWKW